MTLIELLWFLFWIGGGAVASSRITSLFAPQYSAAGGVAGALLGIGAVFTIGQISRRMNRKHAPCKCGKDEWREFKAVRDPDWQFVTQCACGLRYLMRKGWLWFEIRPDGSAIIYMQRDFWGRWRPATERNKANKTVQRTGASRSAPEANRTSSAAGSRR
jgi:hypothetical protein